MIKSETGLESVGYEHMPAIEVPNPDGEKKDMIRAVALDCDLVGGRIQTLATLKGQYGAVPAIFAAVKKSKDAEVLIVFPWTAIKVTQPEVLRSIEARRLVWDTPTEWYTLMGGVLLNVVSVTYFDGDNGTGVQILGKDNKIYVLAMVWSPGHNPYVRLDEVATVA